MLRVTYLVGVLWRLTEVSHLTTVVPPLLTLSLTSLTPTDPRSSIASLTSQVDCPISILPITLTHPSQNRLSSSRSSLPHLAVDAGITQGEGGVGPFTSQYMASRLHDLAGSVGQGGVEEEVETIGRGVGGGGGRGSCSSTHNLVSLSHLFRQLRPYIVQSSSRERRERTRSARLEYVKFDGQPVKQPQQQQQLEEPHHRQQEHPSQQHSQQLSQASSSSSPPPSWNTSVPQGMTPQSVSSSQLETASINHQSSPPLSSHPLPSHPLPPHPLSSHPPPPPPPPSHPPPPSPPHPNPLPAQAPAAPTQSPTQSPPLPPPSLSSRLTPTDRGVLEDIRCSYSSLMVPEDRLDPSTSPALSLVKPSHLSAGSQHSGETAVLQLKKPPTTSLTISYTGNKILRTLAGRREGETCPVARPSSSRSWESWSLREVDER